MYDDDILLTPLDINQEKFKFNSSEFYINFLNNYWIVSNLIMATKVELNESKNKKFNSSNMK